MIQYLLISSFLFLTVACGQTEQNRVQGLEHKEGAYSALSQRATLSFVFFKDNPMPPAPTSQELEFARERYLQKDMLGERIADQKLLKKLFGSVLDLWVYAMRDTDGDGIKDFRVSEHYGKFYEGDIDIDGDGVRNVFDQDPYDPSVGFVDTNRNSIPDAADWRFYKEKESYLQAMQEHVYLKYGVLMVDRSSKIDLKLAQAFIDVIERFLGAEAILNSRALEVLAAERSLMIDPTVPEDGESSGYMLNQLQTMSIYEVENPYPAFLTLGLIAHELAHVIQMGMDFSPWGKFAENAEPFLFMPNFFSMMSGFGWQTSWRVPQSQYQWIKPHFQDYDFNYKYKGLPTEQWKTWLETLYKENGDQYLDSIEARNENVVGDYSMVDPLEWHSDHFMAYVFVEIEKMLIENCGNRRWVMEFFRQMERGPLREFFPWFRYRNTFGSQIYDHFKRRFPLKKTDHRNWLRHYFGMDFDIQCEWRF